MRASHKIKFVLKIIFILWLTTSVLILITIEKIVQTFIKVEYTKLIHTDEDSLQESIYQNKYNNIKFNIFNKTNRNSLKDNVYFTTNKQQNFIKFWKLMKKIQYFNETTTTSEYSITHKIISSVNSTNVIINLWRPNHQTQIYNDERYLSLSYIVPTIITQFQKSSKLKTILIHDQFKWWGQQKWKQYHKLDNCTINGFNECLLVENPFNLSVVDAVVTVRESLFTLFNNILPLKVPSHVLKFNYILESPFTSRALFLNPNERLASYWRGSDIVSPYFKWIYYNTTIRRLKQSINYAHGKSKMVAIFVSNCDAINNRLDYVKELQKYIPVDIYGKCGPFKCPRKNGTFCLEHLKKVYLFYLAFENANCRDYITEKLSINALQNNVLPVVMGAKLEDYKALAPENSYIHIEDFNSPKELAMYLKFLKENQVEYNKYFEWIGAGKFVSTDFFCQLCLMVHYSDLYPPSKSNTKLIWRESQAIKTNMCLPDGRWYWTKNN